MTTLTLETEVLEWAAEQIGESLGKLSESLARRDKDRAAIRTGRLTPSQATKFARVTRVPFGFLFLDKPPAVLHAELPDLRQSPQASPLSDDFHEVLEDARRKQQWFSDYLRSSGIPAPSFVGLYKAGKKPSAETLATTISESLGLTGEERRESPTQEAYFSALSARAEAAGILVLKSGIVRSNTRRALTPGEFRGFALADPFAPLVFVNGKDWEVAWVFTLMHEIAHIFLGESGVSDIGVSQPGQGVEALCNAAAAELLVPRKEFLKAFEITSDLSALAKRFRVSRLVIARRALELDRITAAEYQSAASYSAKAKPPAGEGGGSAYANIPVRNSKRLTKALVISAAAGRTLFREAASLLNVKPDTVAGLAQRMRADV